MNTVIKLPVQ